MNILIPPAIVLAAALLSACPDSNFPKAPPQVPEPKASVTDIPAVPPATSSPLKSPA